MNEPIVFKRSVLIGQLVLIQLLVPPLVAIGTLYALTVLYGARFDGEFRTLSVLVAILAPTVMKRPQINTLTILPRWGSIAVSLVMRWLVLLALLFAIGYATKTSTEFSRRVVLTWAFITPAPADLRQHHVQRDRAQVHAGLQQPALGGRCRLQRRQHRAGVAHSR